MYKNTGKKIVAMANIFAGIMFIGSIIAGVAVWDAAGDDIAGIYYGIGTAVIGFVIAWVSNLLLAGFGELILNSHESLAIAKGETLETKHPYPWFMEGAERNICKLFLGKWNTVTIVAVAVGAALFGVLMVFGSIPVFTNTFLTSAMIIPVIVGGLFGPLPAFATMLVGNFVADLIGGWGFWFDWSVGNGVMGLFIGALLMYGARIDQGFFHVKHAIMYVICVVAGCIVAYGVVTPIMTAIFYAADLEITFIQAAVAGVANAAVLIIIGLPLLFLFANRYKKRSNLKEED